MDCVDEKQQSQAPWWVRLVVPDGRERRQAITASNLLGDDFFQGVTAVILPTSESDFSSTSGGVTYTFTFDHDWLLEKDREIEALMPRLRRLRNLRVIYLGVNMPEFGLARIGVEVEQTMIKALPHCRIARQQVLKGRFTGPSTSTGSLSGRSPSPVGSASTDPARLEALELRGFEGLTPRRVE